MFAVLLLFFCIFYLVLVSVLKNDVMSEAVQDPSFCLEKRDSDGTEVYGFKRNHSYYYQVSYAQSDHMVMHQ